MSALPLHSRADAVARRWGLRIGEAYPAGLSQHWAARVTLPDGGPAVLKLGVPQPAGLGLTPLACEAAALRAYAGVGAVRLLDLDLALGALLLERADPGTRLATLVPGSDAEATSALAAVLLELHACRPPAEPLPELAGEIDSFTEYLAEYPPDEPDGPLPGRLVDRAAGLFAELVGSATRQVVLHGDLHHDNVLAATRSRWLAIDPHGLLGDPGYDLGAMVYNPGISTGISIGISIGTSIGALDRNPALARLVPARVEQLADQTGIDADRVVAWAFVKAVLSELWTWEDGERPGGRALDVAQLLASRLP